MSAVFSIERPASSTLKLNSTPQQKFWFDPPATRPTLSLMVSCPADTVAAIHR